MSAPDWTCSSFEELDREFLYAMLNLRAEIFVVEQDCAYQDLDGHDQDALHLCGLYDEELACYARINAPGAKTGCTSISRVMVRKNHRNGGLGRMLMNEALARCERLWPGTAIGVSAQQHLVDFYASLGFRAISEPYDDEGIPHVDMLRQTG